ncbi:MAG: hypothetical protein M3Q40_07950 [Pseudomonadota bacterium]|nr:hypothetical protein [Pseudomonadota bacterium]
MTKTINQCQMLKLPIADVLCLGRPEYHGQDGVTACSPMIFDGAGGPFSLRPEAGAAQATQGFSRRKKVLPWVNTFSSHGRGWS